VTGRCAAVIGVVAFGIGLMLWAVLVLVCMGLSDIAHSQRLVYLTRDDGGIHLHIRTFMASPSPTRAEEPAISQLAPPASRVFTDVTSDFLIGLSSTANLTHAQTALLLAPYRGLWMRVEGSITDVIIFQFRALMQVPHGQVIVTPLGATQSEIHGFFATDLESVGRLSKGSQAHFVGRISEVVMRSVQLVDCELQASLDAQASPPKVRTGDRDRDTA
jgi:hypothetical protein